MTLKNNVKVLILGIDVILIFISIYLALVYTPSHETMGDVQRIFYFHVASAWISYLAFGVTFVAGLLYLKSKDLKWDTVAYGSAEIGIIFCTLALITGSLWGKAAWGVFWRWEDLKLFITLVLWLVFIAYLALRANAKSRTSKANLSAVFGIIGFICVPLSFAANRIWQQYHPTVIATSQGGLRTSMAFALVVAVFAFTFLYLYLLFVRVDIEIMRETTEEIKQLIGGQNV
jgi:heme exporter protein C